MQLSIDSNVLYSPLAPAVIRCPSRRQSRRCRRSWFATRSHRDVIAHNLTKLLGNPHTLATSDLPSSSARVANERAPMLTSGIGGAL